MILDIVSHQKVLLITNFLLSHIILNCQTILSTLFLRQVQKVLQLLIRFSLVHNQIKLLNMVQIVYHLLTHQVQ